MFMNNLKPPAIPSERVRLLNEAAALTSGDRNKAYGEPVANMAHIASIFNAVTGRDISGREVAIMMSCVKMARRAKNITHCDSYLDNMAYVGIEWECALEESLPKDMKSPHAKD
jgi:hypothetical protein